MNYIKDNVTFLLKATNDKTIVYRCLESIKRQTNSNFKVIALCSFKDKGKSLKSRFPFVKIFPIKSAKEFPENISKVLPMIETEYFMFVNFDSVIAPNTVSQIVENNCDSFIFNISCLKGKKFKIRYLPKDMSSLSSYLKKGANIWSSAFKTELIHKNDLSISQISFIKQTVFLLECYSLSDSVNLSEEVLVYREKLMKKKGVLWEDFEEEKRTLKNVLKRFKKKEQYDVVQQIVKDFAVVQLEQLYKEKSFFKASSKRRMLRKFIGL